MKTILTLSAALAIACAGMAVPYSTPANGASAVSATTTDAVADAKHRIDGIRSNGNSESSETATKPRRLRGNGRQFTQTFVTADAYNSIHVSDGIEVTVSASAEYISVTADENIIKYVTTDRSGRTLRFSANSRVIDGGTVQVTVPASTTLRNLTAENGGSINCETPLGYGNVNIQTSGGGRVVADITEAGRLTMKISSASSFKGSAECRSCDITLSNASRVDARIKSLGDCRLNCSGASAFTGALEGADCNVAASGGSCVEAHVKSGDNGTVTLSKASSFTGTLEGADCNVAASGGSCVEAHVKSGDDGTVTLSKASSFSGSMQAVCGKIILSDGSVAEAQVDCSGKCEATVLSSSSFNGSINAGHGTFSVLGGSVFNAPIACDVHADITLSRSGSLEGNLSGQSLHIHLSSGSVLHGDASADVVLIEASNSSYFDGDISAEGQANLAGTSGSIITGSFTGGHIHAAATNSAFIELLGSATVPTAVIAVSSGGIFNAPDLRVTDYSITASSSGHAEVYCTGLLNEQITSGGTVSHNGECRVQQW